MGRFLLVAPVEMPVDVAAAMVQIRTEDAAEIPHLEELIAAATEHAESDTWRRFVTQKWKETFDAFPVVSELNRRAALELSFPPLASVQSVKYIDSNGTLQTLATTEYTVRTGALKGAVVPAYGKVWPSTRDEEGAVRVEFTCGYGAAAAVPVIAKRAILQIVATLYDHRANVVTGTIATELPQGAQWALRKLSVR